MQSLTSDILHFVCPVALGLLLLLAGVSSLRWPRMWRNLALLLTVGLVAAAGLLFTSILPDQAHDQLSRIGGATVLLSWLALFLLGCVWKLPNRSFSTSFLAMLAALAGTLLVIEASPRLWWGRFAPASWERTADAQGRLRQSSGLTCSPAAAVMLLHHYGIIASEGELAYRARTSLLGTDAYSMARAIREKVERHDYAAVARHTDLDACVLSGQPFLAHVRGVYMGHALFVRRAFPDHVDIVDPLDGSEKKLTRQAFEEIWDRTVIQIIRS